jgi:hypothetical protein
MQLKCAQLKMRVVNRPSREMEMDFCANYKTQGRLLLFCCFFGVVARGVSPMGALYGSIGSISLKTPRRMFAYLPG